MKTVKTAVTILAVLALSSAATAQEVENVSLQMNLSPSTDIYVDGDLAQEKTYSSNEIDFPYITNDEPVGIIGLGELKNINYSNNGKEVLEVTQKEGNFIIPNTQGGYTAIEDDKDDIRSQRFLERVNPSFGFPPVETPNVRVIYRSDVKIEGFEGRAENSVEIYSRHKLNSSTKPEVKLGLN
ncbi:MAG: hypothetical protein BRC29_00055 [Nanohaloarchaea archaeon SW_7_43_1]|nr:MAG: hypothetical protein BRC29_00055 [Nanohaloarchaea archaeon SW_7_43_1]